jgi:Flp pilus assembly protein TadD
LPRVAEAKYAAQRALVIEPELAEAWASLGVLADDFERDHRFAELALRRAIQLKPSYASAHLWLGAALRRSGRLESNRRAVELDPIGTQAIGSYATALSIVGRWAEAREMHLRLHRLGSPGTAQLVAHARWLFFDVGEIEVYARDWAVLEGHSQPDKLLLQSIEQGDPFIVDLVQRPVLAPLRSDPRFVRILEELNLPIGAPDRDSTALVERTGRR